MDNKYLKYIFDELLKSNISVINQEVKTKLAETAVYLISKTNHNNDEIECMKYLIMICNILYNRTDLLVLPVEDGIYDMLMESYKRYDNHFQVGSAVVQFQSQMEKSNPEVKQIVKPFVFIKPHERDDLEQAIFDRLLLFDRHKLNSDDLVVNPFIYDGDYISKRAHNTGHNHPELVGTLDKCKFVTNKEAIDADSFDTPNVSVLERDFFEKHIQNGIIHPEEELMMVLELKYDGISVEADCNREVVSARTRGDTGIGQASDITPILKGYQFHHNKTILDHTIGVKFEAIMTKTDLEKFNIARGYQYANCRTAIVGLFGASDANKYRDYITLVPLAVDLNDVPGLEDRIMEIEFCNNVFRSNGEPLRYMIIKGNYHKCLYQIKKFLDEAYAFREYANFMFDGIVVSYVDPVIRKRLGRENYINKYSMAVKFNPMSKLTTFLGYTYEIGQNGNICPMFHYSPVEFIGTIHTKSTASSYKRFLEMNLKVGDIIRVTYVNDVMPYVERVDCEENKNNPNPVEMFPVSCPECGSPIMISDSGKSATCTNVRCPGRTVSRMTNMLQKLNLKGFAESTIRSLNVTSLTELMKLPVNVLVDKLGNVTGNTLYNNLHELSLNKIPEDYMIIGALGFTGIAQQKWKCILKQYTLEELIRMAPHKDKFLMNLSSIRGVGELTAEIVVTEFPYFLEDLTYIRDHFNYSDTKYSQNTTGKVIRFSGCRNLQLVEQLRNLGCDATDGGVTKETNILLVPYTGFSSTKTKKVSSDCVIVPIDEFKNNMELYLNN